MIGVDKPQLAILLVQDAIAGMLKNIFPDDNIEAGGPLETYNNPAQQNIVTPCWFINFIPPNTITGALSQRYWRNWTIDLVFMSQFNEPNLFDQYYQRIEVLDEQMEYIQYPYTYRESEEAEPEDRVVLLRALEREWSVDLSMLHYRFALKLWTSKIKDDSIKMMKIEELNEYVKEVLPDGSEIWQKWH